MKLLLVFLAITFSVILKAQSIPIITKSVSERTVAELPGKADISYTIIPSVNNTWGYDIFIAKRLIIHQPGIPGLPGNEGFQSQVRAKKSAKQIIRKINRRQMHSGIPGNSSPQLSDTWVQKASFPGSARILAVGFSIGGKVYIGTGENGSYFREFWEFDTTANTWTQKANFGGTARNGAVGFSIGTKGYIGTGAIGYNNFKNDLWEYDPVSNTWTQKANFGGSGRSEAVGFSIGMKGYIGTGAEQGGFYKNDFWEYDPVSNVWTQKADFPGGVRMGAVGFGTATHGYIGTGTGTGGLKKDFWEYDPSANGWTQKADFPGMSRCYAVGFSIGSLGYIGTGYTNLWVKVDHDFSDFWEYDPVVNSWTQKADFGGGGRDWEVGFSIGNRGFIGIGTNMSGFQNDFWEYIRGCTSLGPPTNTTPQANQSICTGNSTTLSASGSGTLGWYSAATGGTWLGGGTSYTTPILTNNTTYWVQDSTACGPSLSRTAIAVTVNPLPIPTITGQTSLCINSGYFYYNTEAGMLNYMWTVSSGGMINYGAGTNQIQVSWHAAGAQTVSVTYNNANGCSAAIPTVLYITVIPLPGQAGTISGTSTVCAGTNNVSYTIAPVANTTYYVWTLPPHAMIASGTGTNFISVDFADSATSGNISVYGNSICGNGQPSPDFPVTVNPIPLPPVITNTGDTLYSSFPNGNQWYMEGIPIIGATTQTYIATQNGDYWDVVTINGCSSDTSNHKLILITGREILSASTINVYPVPNDGRFNVFIPASSGESLSISVYNELGLTIYEETNVSIKGSIIRVIDLKQIPCGVYTIVFKNIQNQLVKKIVVSR
jgi:N-acetylneuraminic acid mutarotase